MSVNETLPAWPEEPAYDTMVEHDDMLTDYLRARADAAMARLKYALIVLREVGQHIDVLPGTIQAGFFEGCPDIHEALTTIGDLP